MRDNSEIESKQELDSVVVTETIAKENKNTATPETTAENVSADENAAIPDLDNSSDEKKRARSGA